MSRWLWALLAGVVLVAIAAVFWIDQTSVLPPVLPGPNACRSRAALPPASFTVAERPAPSAARIASPPLSPAPPAAQQAAAPPAPAPPAHPAPDAGQQAASPPAPTAPPKSPRLRPSSPRSLRPRLLRLGPPNHPCRRPRPDGRRGSRGHICAQEPCAAGRDLGLFRGGLRAALPAARRRLGLSAAGGQVRPGRDCRVAEEDPSPFRDLPDRRRIRSGRHAQGKRRLRGLD